MVKIQQGYILKENITCHRRNPSGMYFSGQMLLVHLIRMTQNHVIMVESCTGESYFKNPGLYTALKLAVCNQSNGDLFTREITC